MFEFQAGERRLALLRRHKAEHGDIGLDVAGLLFNIAPNGGFAIDPVHPLEIWIDDSDPD